MHLVCNIYLFFINKIIISMRFCDFSGLISFYIRFIYFWKTNTFGFYIFLYQEFIMVVFMYINLKVSVVLGSSKIYLGVRSIKKLWIKIFSSNNSENATLSNFFHIFHVISFPVHSSLLFVGELNETLIIEIHKNFLSFL